MGELNEGTFVVHLPKQFILLTRNYLIANLKRDKLTDN